MALSRRTKAILAAVAVAILAAAGILFYVVRGIIYGREALHGSRSGIPAPKGTLSPPSKGAADWPCWRGPTLDGKSAIAGIRTDWSGGLRKLWEVDFLCQGSESVTWSAPAVQGNRLVVPGRDKDRDLVLCLDPATGGLLWVGSYEARTGSGHGPGARATPFIDDDRVYTFGRGGHLACWNLHDGKLLWLANVEDEGGKEPDWGHSSSPLVLGDLVVVQAGGAALAAAYDKRTGKPAWKGRAGAAAYAAVASVNVEGNPFLLVFHATGLAVLSPADGQTLGEVPWKTRYDIHATTPAADGATVFITSGYGTGGGAVRVGKDGAASLLWSHKAVASHHSDPILLDGHVYGYSGQSLQNRGHFKCLELRSGRELWSTDQVGWGTVLHVDGHLLCMDIRGNLHLVKPDPGAFRKVAEFRSALGEVVDPAWTMPVAANGRLYLRYMQRLVCYDLMR